MAPGTAALDGAAAHPCARWRFCPPHATWRNSEPNCQPALSRLARYCRGTRVLCGSRLRRDDSISWISMSVCSRGSRRLTAAASPVQRSDATESGAKRQPGSNVRAEPRRSSVGCAPSAPARCWAAHPVSQRRCRSIGTSGGDPPTWIVPRTSKPWRRYRGTFLGLLDSK